MAAADLLINEVAERFGIGGKAISLLSGLLSLMTNQETGGISGFIDRFKQAGMGELVSSWISIGSNHPITPNQIQNALGIDTIDRIADSVGLSNSKVSAALAFMIPQVIDYLTPDGVVPSALRGDFSLPPSGVFGTTLAPALSGGSTSRKILPYLVLTLLGIMSYRYYTHGLVSQSAAMDPLMTDITPTINPAATTEAIDPNSSLATQLAIRRTKAALARLTPDFTAQDLVKVLNLETINFASGSATISDEKLELLREFAAAILNAPQTIVIEVGGHTDNTGSTLANKILSQQRAAAVRDYLIKQGGLPTSLTAKGFGDSKPIASNDTEEGRLKNRRIEFTVVK